MARERVQDAETEMMQEMDDMRYDDKARSTTTQPESMFAELLNTIWDSLSNHAKPEDEEDGEEEVDDEEDTDLGKLTEDDEPGWVMSTVSNTLQHRMESFRQKQKRIDELTQPGCRDPPHYFLERDMKYGTKRLKDPAVVEPLTDTTAATLSPTTFEEHMLVPDIVPRKSQMPQVTSHQGCSQIRLHSEKPQADNHIVFLIPDMVPGTSQREIAMPVPPVRIQPSI